MCTSNQMSCGNVSILCKGNFLPVAQMVEHGARSVKIMGSIPRVSKNALDKKDVSAKCINVNIT